MALYIVINIKMLKKIKHFIIFFTVFVLLISILFIFIFEKLAMPICIRIANEQAVSRINTAIGTAVEQSIQSLELSSNKLYTAQYDLNGKISSINVDSVLVNKLCANTAEDVSLKLNSLSAESIGVPLGVLTGIGLLSDKGPKISVHISPSGSATADYESEVISTGIGQVNFKVWLVVNTEVGLVNPLVNDRLNITRKIMLVNTVFSGEVPKAFYGIEKTSVN
jgi:sporulation protein YunB